MKLSDSVFFFFFYYDLQDRKRRMGFHNERVGNQSQDRRSRSPVPLGQKDTLKWPQYKSRWHCLSEYAQVGTRLLAATLALLTFIRFRVHLEQPFLVSSIRGTVRPVKLISDRLEYREIL